jgi:DNA-binding Lrp family transcriptional regulator
MENNREIERTEYEIRKLERGVKVAHKCLLDIRGTSVDYDFMIKQYVKDIKELRDRLEKLTEKKHFSSGRWKIITKGRRRPNIPKWPI